MDIQNLTKSDLEFALNLIKLEKWGTDLHELEDLLIFSPKGAFIAKIDDFPVGMVFTISYNNFAFIGNLIVQSEFRRQGIGFKLMKKAIKHLKEKGNSSILLDAVPAIVPLYQQLGFEKVCKSLRLEGKIIPKKNKRVFQMKEDDFPDVIKLDLKLFGADRSILLRKIFSRHEFLCKVIKLEEKLTGFIMAIPKQTYLKVGPWIVDDCEPHPELLLKNLNYEMDPPIIRLGMLESNKYASNIAKNCGLKTHFYSFRMVYGKKITQHKGMIAIGGPDRG